LIAISLELTAFLSKDIDSSITFEISKYLTISIIVSSVAVICGLLAWKFSSKMFYDTRNGILQGFNHKLKGVFDFSLAVLLIVAIIMTATYLVKERNQTITNKSSRPLKFAATNSCRSYTLFK